MVKKHGIQGDLARGKLEPGAHPASRLNPEGDLGGQGQGARDGAGRRMRPEAVTQGLRRQAGSSPALVHLLSPGELSRRPSPRAGGLTDPGC